MVGSSAGRMVKLPLLERAGISALAGGIAGGFTNATLHPIDTVKTKLQTRGASKLYSGPLDVVSKVNIKQLSSYVAPVGHSFFTVIGYHVRIVEGF